MGTICTTNPDGIHYDGDDESDEDTNINFVSNENDPEIEQPLSQVFESKQKSPEKVSNLDVEESNDTEIDNGNNSQKTREMINELISRIFLYILK